MKAVLKFSDRNNLGALLPTQGSWLTLSTVREIQKTIAPTDADLLAVDGEINMETGVIRYNIQKNNESARDFEFTDIQAKIIRDHLTTLDKQEKLPAIALPLYEAFVIGGVA